MWIILLFSAYTLVLVILLGAWSRKARMTCVKCNDDLGLNDEWKVCIACAPSPLRQTDGD